MNEYREQPIMRKTGLSLPVFLLLFLLIPFSCDYPTGELTIKNGTDKVVTITVIIHTDQNPPEEIVLKAGDTKKYEFDQIVTEIVVYAQAWDDYENEVPLGRQSIRPVDIVRGNDRVLTILLEDDRIAWDFKSLSESLLKGP